MEILLVDDDEPSLSSLARFLRSEGHRVDSHQSPASALGVCQHRRFDLLVSDYHLPGMDGLSLIRAVRGLQPRIGTILYSGLHSADTLQQAHNQGVDTVLGKPLRIRDLLAAIQNLPPVAPGPGPASLAANTRPDELSP
ncbi:MAG: response regulator [Calditrichaeota bacterium]|nr:response regulator [Calditrichota bacterium]